MMSSEVVLCGYLTPSFLFLNKDVTMQHRESIMTLATLANASELARIVAQGVLGNEVADSINGSELTRQALYDLSQADFQGSVSTLVRGI